jgi:FtsH-binding integral membrane protein
MTDSLAKHHKPKNVLLAVRLLWATIALGLMSTALYWNDKISQLPADFPMNPELFASIVLFITFSFLVWIMWQVSRGRNWARLLYLIVFLIGLPLYIPALLVEFDHSVGKGIFSTIITFMQLAALILLFTKEGNVWFKEQKALKAKKG